MGLALVTWCREQQAPTKERKDQVRAQFWKLSLFGLFLVYPSVSATVVQLYRCHLVEGEWYLVADYRMLCYDSEWWGYGILGFVAFLLYPIGIPGLFWVLLRLNMEVLHDDAHPDYESVHDKLGFIYSSYEPQAWYWELVELAQKFLLTGVVIFLYPGTMSQIAYAFLFSIFFFILHIRTNA